MKKLLLLCMAVWLCFGAHAQVTKEWSNTYNNPDINLDEAIVDRHAMLVDDAGNMYVGGLSTIDSNYDARMTIVKYKPDGSLAWDVGENFNFVIGVNSFHSVGLDDSGYVYAFGDFDNTWRSVHGRSALAIRYNTSNGVDSGQFSDIHFFNTIHPSTSAERFYTAKTMVVKGNYMYAVVNTDIPWIGYHDFTLQKTFNFKSDMWTSGIADSTRMTNINDMVVDDEGNIYLCGSFYSDSTSSGPTSIIVYKYDGSGTMEWSKEYMNSSSSAGYSAPTGLAADASGNVFLSGITYNSTLGGSDGILLKYDKDGDLLWTKKMSDLGLSGQAFLALAMGMDENGDIIISGKRTNSGSTQVLTVKYGNNGSELWHQLISRTNGSVEATALKVDKKGNTYITGSAETSTGTDILAAKYNKDGDLLWQTTIDQDDFDDAVGVGYDSSGNLYIAGNAFNQTTVTQDIVTAKFSQQLHAGFTSTIGCDGTVTLNNFSSVPKGDMIYEWNLGDGNVISTEDITHFYTPGSYSILLTVTDENGMQDTQKMVITVPGPVKAAFAADDHVCLGSSASFANSSSIAIGNLAYSWDFGDGTNSTSTSPSHTYDSAGTYVVKLKATSANGCFDIATATVVVDPLPDADFSITKMTNVIVSFVPANQTYSSYLWDFGDGDTSSYISPKHKYRSAGTYDVSLTVTDKGCSDTVMKTYEVITTGLDETDAPTASGLKVYPVPFRDQASINYTISRDAAVSLELTDALGRHISLLSNVKQAAGEHTFRLNDTYGLAAGMVHVRLLLNAKPAGSISAILLR